MVHTTHMTNWLQIVSNSFILLFIPSMVTSYVCLICRYRFLSASKHVIALFFTISIVLSPYLREVCLISVLPPLIRLSVLIKPDLAQVHIWDFTQLHIYKSAHATKLPLHFVRESEVSLVVSCP